ncbi:MAG: TolC family protein [Myxococcaceae bacterium]
MSNSRRRGAVFGLALILGATAAPARAENLREAWRIALAVDQQLQASRDQSIAAGWDLAAVRAQRYPKLQTFNAPAFLTNPLFPATGGTGAGTGSGTGSTPVAGSNQKDFFASAVVVTQPLYSGGRVSNTIRANQAQVNAARADEARTALDLLLDVAGAYVGVLRANREVEVAHTNVENLASQARDVANLVRGGRSIRNDLLATQVALANARQNEVRARNNLDNARAAYNRLLGRPLEVVVPLEDMAPPPLAAGAEDVVAGAADRSTDLAIRDEGEFRVLFDRALRARPELAALSEQARALAFQATAERASTKPQAAFTVANIYQNSQVISTQDFGTAAFIVSWTPFDGGIGRRRSMALKLRESATLHQHADLASVIAQQVRRSWLAVQEATRRVQVTRGAIVQSEENLQVTRNRYLQQRAINTEVLDAETLRVQSYNNYYNAVYDAVQADIQLRHDVGDLLGMAPLSPGPR